MGTTRDLCFVGVWVSNNGLGVGYCLYQIHACFYNSSLLRNIQYVFFNNINSIIMFLCVCVGGGGGGVSGF